jgi:hypothetical protein
MAVTLQNRARSLVTFILPHHVACSETSCGCTRQVVGVTDIDKVSGKKTVRALKRKLAASITLMAAGHEGDTLEGLNDGVAMIPEVRAAEKAGSLHVVREGGEAPKGFREGARPSAIAKAREELARRAKAEADAKIAAASQPEPATKPTKQPPPAPAPAVKE